MLNFKFQFAMEKQYNATSHLFKLNLNADLIRTVDAYKLTRIICRQVSQGGLFCKTIFFHGFDQVTDFVKEGRKQLNIRGPER